MSVVAESEGFFNSLLGSVKTHLEDRLQSPFAGAFAIAWIASNWKALLILIFSTTSIESRIEVVSAQYFAPAALLWKPLLYSSLGVVAYYIAATVFLGFFEIYGMSRRAVERYFDNQRWVDPSRYMDFKRETRSQIDYLSALASDHLEQVAALQSELATNIAARDLAQNRLQEIESSVSLLTVREKNLTEKVSSLQKAISDSEVKYIACAKSRDQTLDTLVNADAVIKKVADFVASEKPGKETDGIGSGLLKLMRPGRREELISELDSLKLAIRSTIEFQPA